MGDTWAPREGAYGRTRDGQRVGPIKANTSDGRWPWWGTTGCPVPFWDADGHWRADQIEHDSDLIAEWSEPAGLWVPREGAYGRTRDGQRVGPLSCDRTMLLDGNTNAWRGGVRGDGTYPTWYPNGRFAGDLSSWIPNKGHVDTPLDLVAEWSEDGPVRTVTRREIVPGTYGFVHVIGRYDQRVDGSKAPLPPIIYVPTPSSGEPFTADELDAAARVLTELAGALRNG